MTLSLTQLKAKQERLTVLFESGKLSATVYVLLCQETVEQTEKLKVASANLCDGLIEKCRECIVVAGGVL